MGLAGHEDDEHFAYARSAGRILITKNPDDFVALHNAQPDHPGILLIYQDNDRRRDMTPAEIVAAIANLAQAYAAAGLSLTGQVHNLNDWRY